MSAGVLWLPICRILRLCQQLSTSKTATIRPVVWTGYVAGDGVQLAAYPDTANTPYVVLTRLGQQQQKRSTMRYTRAMNREISQRELRNDSAEVLRAVKEGECITVTSNGVPVAELVPLRRGRFVDAQVAIEAFADAPSIDLKTLRDDLDLIGDPDFLPRG